MAFGAAGLRGCLVRSSEGRGGLASRRRCSRQTERVVRHLPPTPRSSALRPDLVPCPPAGSLDLVGRALGCLQDQGSRRCRLRGLRRPRLSQKTMRRSPHRAAAARIALQTRSSRQRRRAAHPHAGRWERRGSSSSNLWERAASRARRAVAQALPRQPGAWCDTCLWAALWPETGRAPAHQASCWSHRHGLGRWGAAATAPLPTLRALSSERPRWQSRPAIATPDPPLPELSAYQVGQPPVLPDLPSLATPCLFKWPVPVPEGAPGLQLMPAGPSRRRGTPMRAPGA